MTGKLVTVSDPTSAAAEAFRRLRTNVTFAQGADDTALQTVLVAAASSDGEKAATVANLAVAFAKVGKRTVLVDTDLRHPAQHTLFGLPNTDGVTSALQNIGDTLPLQDSQVPCLRILTSGPSVEVPSDAIASAQMAELIARLRQEADIVIFDAPPVTLATDAAELASQVDGVLLTVSAGHTKREDAREAKDLLARVGAHVIGVALINVPADAELNKYLAS